MAAHSIRHWIYSANPLLTLIVEDHTAVGLFIVMSGYILSAGAIGNRLDYGRFIAARALRIFPSIFSCLRRHC